MLPREKRSLIRDEFNELRVLDSSLLLFLCPKTNLTVCLPLIRLMEDMYIVKVK